MHLAAAVALEACATLPGATTPVTALRESALAAAVAASSPPPSPRERVSFAALQDQVYLEQATEFLNGASESCFRRSLPWECLRWPFLHPPFGSLIRHLHRDPAIPDYSPYYYDPIYNGLDLDRSQGWEGANVILYAGRGFPIAWTTYRYAQPPKDPAISDVLACLNKVRIGDGAARYLLMLSCQVMAHGPQSCGSNPNSFGCPEAFAPSAPALQHELESCTDLGVALETARGHHNVFERWRTHMSPRLRLACGGSTTLSPSGAPERFWQAHGVLGLPVADAFLLSLSVFNDVPLCLTKGNGRPQDTPLYDQEFVPTENLAQEGTYVYAMFPVRGTPAANAVAGALMDVVGPHGPIEKAETTEDDWAPPILEVARPTLPGWLAAVADSPAIPKGEFGFRSVPPEVVPAHAQPLQHDALTIQVHPRSGALKIRWRSPPQPPSMSLAAALSSLFGRLDLSARRLLTGGDGRFKAEPIASGLALQIDRVAAATATTVKPEHFQKCAYGRLDPRVKVEGSRIGTGSPLEAVSHVLPAFSPGSEWLLQACPPGPDSTPGVDGTSLVLAGNDELSLAFVGRQVVAAHPAADLGIAPARTRPVARAVAWSKLADQIGVSVAEAMEAFAPPADTLGYLAAPIHCRQTHMYPIYRFTFRHRPSEPAVPESPIEIDVSVYGPGMAFASEEWVCDPQFPL
jgi:hypothetical protein